MMGTLVFNEFSGVSVFVRREQLAPKLSVHSSRRGQVHRKTWRMTEALKCTVNAIIHCVGSNSGDVQITKFFSHKHILSNSLWGAVDIMATWLRQKVVYVRQTLPWIARTWKYSNSQDPLSIRDYLIVESISNTPN